MSAESVTLGVSVEWSDGRYRFAGGTEPWALGVAALVAWLYYRLMDAATTDSTKPLPGVFRRFVAFCLDFGLATSILAPTVGVVPMLVEWRRTKVFTWTFERTMPATGDMTLALLSAGLAFAGLLCYYTIPIVRRRPSPGACIVSYQVLPENGGVLTLRRASLRTLLGFIAVCGAWLAPFVGRDRNHGKFWLDKVFNTQATLLS
jgi:hypothetical protein